MPKPTKLQVELSDPRHLMRIALYAARAREIDAAWRRTGRQTQPVTTRSIFTAEICLGEAIAAAFGKRSVLSPAERAVVKRWLDQGGGLDVDGKGKRPRSAGADTAERGVDRDSAEGDD